jgi:hypothetical protein
VRRSSAASRSSLIVCAKSTALARSSATIRVMSRDCRRAIHITAGNFRLIDRLLSQIERILHMNGLSAATPRAIDVTREGLVIGTA